jgi:hypothetical protein
MMRRISLLPLAALAACGSPEQPAEDAPQAEAPTTPPELAPAPEPTRDLAVLDNRDCRTVAQAYADAVALRDFEFAARAWSDPVIDGARLDALFAEYERPAIEISDVREEGAAGSLYCTVTGSLRDLADAGKPTRQGQVVLRRANEVPGATPEQLRWTIQSSTFVENMERSGRGEPA